ncbi:hypothetical protein EG329_011670 [Mollisiaceae sp. DMI_Dod_QoI]|nr:hypothetical protein EG329_011670 [Helotiales sp. DMI_Dod_QoI]
MDYFNFTPASPDDETPPSADYATAPSSRIESPALSAEVKNEPSSHTDGAIESPGSEPGAVDAVEKDVQQIGHDVEQLLSLSQCIQKDFEGLKRDTHIDNHEKSQSTSPPLNSPAPAKEQEKQEESPPFPTPIVISPTPFRVSKLNIHRRSFSSPSTSTPIPPPSPFPQPQPRPNAKPNPNPDPDVPTLRTALRIIQSHLSSLDTSIRANIASQLKDMDLDPEESDLAVVLDEGSLPSFKPRKGKGREMGEVEMALLGTVKVCCVLERGLEALVGVLELGLELGLGGEDGGDGGDDGGERGGSGVLGGKGKGMGKEREVLDGDEEEESGGVLMGVCLEHPRVVRREMRSALKGIEGVVRFDGKAAEG